jgi:mannitol/fructose-specific phosphotransferase system IIA component (Ntr-type)
MISDTPRQCKKTWEELASAASKETDPDEVATIAEEIFAALEQRERTGPTLTENSKAVS